MNRLWREKPDCDVTDKISHILNGFGDAFVQSLSIQDEMDLTWRDKSVSFMAIQRPYKAHRQLARALKIHIYTNVPKRHSVGQDVVMFSERHCGRHFTSIKGSARVQCSLAVSCVNSNCVSYN